MAEKTAPTKATGGGGFTFADKVAAWFLTQILSRKFPLEPEFGPITELHFETSESRNALDDLLLVMKRGNVAVRCAVSVKSNRHLTPAGFNKEFVQDAWQQYRASAGRNANGQSDLLGLIVGAIDDTTLHDWLDIQKQAASTTAERFVERVNNDGQISAAKRKLFESLHEAPPDPIGTARLVARIRVLPFSEDREGECINFCAGLVVGNRIEDGTKLWSRLLQLSAESRSTGGYFDLPKLLRILRPDFELRAHPDFEHEWAQLDSISTSNFQAVRDVIGAQVRVARDEEKQGLIGQIEKHNIIVICGESGSGKSAIIAKIVGSGGIFRRVLWLTAGQLSKASQAEVAHAFSLKHDIVTVIAHSGSQGGVLVVDGFERFEGDSRLRALELIRAVKDEGFAGWKLIITCQPQSWISVQDALIQTGLPSAHRIDFEKPTLAQIFAAVQAIPNIQSLLLRGEIRPILCNLAYLDWVVRADIAQRLTTSTQPLVGETAIIERIWEYWIGTTTDKHARDALLRTLGAHEGEKISGAIHIDTVEPGLLPLLGALERDGVIKIDGPSVQFSHDLGGDWARFRVLTFAQKEVTEKIRSVAHIPRWGRAVRLYAQSLVEHGTGLDSWRSSSEQLSGEKPESKVAGDLFLDGLLFAANSESLLEQVWPDLIADKGAILHRLLKRLLHVASFPDWRFRALADDRNAEQLAVWFRIPQPLYWYPVLRVLSQHSKDVAQHALMTAAQVCTLWLRTMPEGMPGRSEAGQVALALAKETQGLAAEGVIFGGHEQIIYEALLYAGRDFPTEVGQIGLELSARRSEPEHATQRRLAAQKREAAAREDWRKNHPELQRKRPTPIPTLLFHEGPLRPPAPDGPAERVSDAFRAAVLDTPALTGLTNKHPETAREIVLAVCIDEPKPVEPYERPSLLDGYGLAYWPRGYPAQYWKGPFLKFLQDAPEAALDTIVRLVNYATNRWLELAAGANVDEEERRKYALEFRVGDRSVCWVGDPNVYNWHRFIPLHGDVVGCALMALEKWLYDEMEARRSISKWTQYIFERAQSLAFAGVLVSVGLKHPVLFTKDLQPLLGNWRLYDVQLNWSLQETSGSWRIALSGQDAQTIRLATEWNSMPHRRALLQDIGPWLMFQHTGTREYLTARRTEWLKEFEGHGGPSDRNEVFLARFDTENYTETPQEDGTVLIEMHLPADLEAKIRTGQENRDLKLLSLSMAPHARKILDQEVSLSSQDVARFATTIRSLIDWAANDLDKNEQRYRMNAIAGGVAVLIVCHREWLLQNPDIERWCFETLQNRKPVEGAEYESPAAIGIQTAEAFLGEAGVALLQESNADWVMRLAFNGVTAFHYSSTLHTMWRAYLLRARLGEKFDSLVNVVVLWSAVRYATNRESGYYAAPESLAKCAETLYQRYCSGKLNGALIPLQKVETLGRRLTERVMRQKMAPRVRRAKQEWEAARGLSNRDRKLDREHPDIDLEVIQNGFGFLIDMIRNRLPGEQEKVRHYMDELFNVEMRTLPSSPSRDPHSEIQGTPYSYDIWIMERVADFIASTNSIEVARQLYRPILDLGAPGRHWVEDFLQAWIAIGLQRAPDLTTFATVWRDMVEYAMALPIWQPNNSNYWSPTETLAADLMGLRERASLVLGLTKYRSVVIAMVPVFEQWAKAWLKYASVAAWFARFLSTDTGDVLLAQGISQLAAVVNSFRDDDWHRYGLGALLTEALAACWKHLRREVESQSDLRTAFLKILTELTARQIPEALHLRTKVAEAIGAL